MLTIYLAVNLTLVQSRCLCSDMYKRKLRLWGGQMKLQLLQKYCLWQATKINR